MKSIVKNYSDRILFARLVCICFACNKYFEFWCITGASFPKRMSDLGL